MLIVTLLAMLISFRSYQISVEILQDKVGSALQETLTYVGNGVEKELRQVEQISDFIFSNTNIRKILGKNYTHRAERIEDFNRMDDIFNSYSISTVFPYLSAIKIFGNNGEEYSFGGQVYELDSNEVKSQGVQEVLSRNKQTQLWTGIHKAYLLEPFQSRYAVSLYRLMKDEKYAKDTGLLYMSIKPEIFEALLKRVTLHNESEIYIVDHFGKIVYHSGMTKQFLNIGDIEGIDTEQHDSGIFINKSKEARLLVSSYSINTYGWKVYGTIPLNTLIGDNKRIILSSFALAAVILLLASAAWYVILSRITKPLKALTNTMKSVGEGNMFVKFECSREDEIGLLARSFNYMMDKMHNLFDNLLKEQYKVLQAQINPHFLYNTLNSIRLMAIIHRVDNIKEVIDALSRLIMNSMKSEKQFVTIEEEINNLKDYIYIQKIRYNYSFDVEFDIDEELLKYQCISFILQPQVENAIFHGIEPKKGYGLIRVSVQREDEIIAFTIWDNGVGMSEEQIHRLLSENRKEDRGFSGIGIGNVNERIKMLYGKQYGILITSKLGEYTSVKITIPQKIDAISEGGASRPQSGGAEDV